MSTDATPNTSAASTPTTSAVPAADTSALPNDLTVCHQMIAELLRALRHERRDREALERRLDALLRRSRSEPANPNQPLLFPEDATLPSPPAPTAPAEEKTSKRGQSKPHGRRRPASELRREQRRYELTAAERLCPECGAERQEIGVEVTKQYD